MTCGIVFCGLNHIISNSHRFGCRVLNVEKCGLILDLELEKYMPLFGFGYLLTGFNGVVYEVCQHCYEFIIRQGYC